MQINTFDQTDPIFILEFQAIINLIYGASCICDEFTVWVNHSLLQNVQCPHLAAERSRVMRRKDKPSRPALIVQIYRHQF